MGRPLFSISFANPIGSKEDVPLDAVAEEAGPRRWCEKDADPDEDAWWIGKDVIIESFIDRPVESASAHIETEVSTTTQPAANIMASQQDNINSGKLMQQGPTQIQNHHHNIDPASLFPERFTISEEELARVTLDSVVIDEENNNDDDDDFALVWDEERDEYYEDDMEVDEADAPHSDASTPAPSTPVMDPVTESSHLIALPNAASSMHEFSSHCRLPAPATSINAPSPLRQGSFQMLTPSMNPSTVTRSVARVRGFVVHSRRTELVL